MQHISGSARPCGERSGLRRVSLLRAAVCAVMAALFPLTGGGAWSASAAPPDYTSSGHDMSGSDAISYRLGRPVPRFSLEDQYGKPYTQDHMRGKWSMLYFGYTHCADFCPTTLMALRNAYQRMIQEHPNLESRLQIIFVSVDPFRDTPEVLSDYVSYFNPKFVAATGDPAELYRLTMLLGTDYSYVDSATGRELHDTQHQPARDYLVTHGAGVYVFDDRARLVTWAEPPHVPARIVSMMERYMGKSW